MLWWRKWDKMNPTLIHKNNNITHNITHNECLFRISENFSINRYLVRKDLHLFLSFFFSFPKKLIIKYFSSLFSNCDDNKNVNKTNKHQWLHVMEQIFLPLQASGCDMWRILLQTIAIPSTDFLVVVRVHCFNSRACSTKALQRLL